MEHAPLPPDLIELQAHWQRTYAALAVPRPAHATELRRRLHALSGQLLFHPYWSSPRRLPGARVELRRQARALGRLP
ncbi:hypothetical protein ACFWP5_25020 [Streptomyces sp. NPDC058469]|uniref:hypothetical protein n=1 Tax=Streptomyces sp. NPDC058469 TaxID=3346514 RepID=UPI0036687DE0